MHNIMANILLMALLTILETNGIISGSVVVSEDPATVLRHLEIQLLDPATLKIEKQTLTDETGAFYFKNVKPGGYFVRISQIPFREHVAAVSVKNGQEIDIGKQILRLSQVIDAIFEVNEGEKYREDRQKDFAKYDHIRHVNNTLVMTVCEFMKEKTALSASNYANDVVIIGTLVQTPQGSWLQQSCSEPLKSGDFVWPAAVSLEGRLGRRPFDIDAINFVSKPPDEEIDPKDRSRTWAAAQGRLDERENLVAAACGDDGKQCGYGFGPISAPAQLTIFRPIRIFNEPPQK
jgi:hypothetical protein